LTIDRAQSASRELRAGVLVWLGLFLVFAVALFVIEYETAMHFSGVAIDGPFQLLNALRRIQGGYRPGVDFQFFHGFGIPYLHYPLYRLFGGGLRGSELARQGISAVLCPLVFLIFFRVFLGDWRRALCLAAGALAACFLLRLLSILFALNGMLGVRSALPTLFPVVLYLAPTRRWRTIAGGLALGIALFISTEQGMAVTAAYVAVSVILLLRRGEWRGRLTEMVATVGLAMTTLVVCLLVIGGVGGMRGALSYNFRLVPMDQYWFFGAPPNLFITSWHMVAQIAVKVPLVSGCIVLAIMFAAIYLVRMWRASSETEMGRHFALAVLPVYGAVSCASMLGSFATTYAGPCWRAVLILLGLEAVRLAERSTTPIVARQWLGVPRLVGGAVVALCVWTLVRIPLVPRALTTSLPHVIVDHVAGRQPFGISGIWPATLPIAQRTIDQHRGPRGELPTLWSTYAGWIEARNGIYHPSFDYIIHALGPANRRAYVSTFHTVAPRLVQTVLPTYTPYEEWLEDNDWPFYDELLRWYTITSQTPWSLFWERRATPAAEPRLLGEMDVPPGTTALPLPPLPADSSAGTALLEIDVQYEIHNPLRRLPIIGTSPRYLIGIEGALNHNPVSLDPFVGATRFPVFVRAGQAPVLHFETFSLLPRAGWVPKRVRVFVRPIDERNRPWLESLATRGASTND
jgi:hypothetical protein